MIYRIPIKVACSGITTHTYFNQSIKYCISVNTMNVPKTLHDVLIQDKELLETIQKQSEFIHRLSDIPLSTDILDIYKEYPLNINTLIVTRNYHGLYNDVTAYIPVIPDVYYIPGDNNDRLYRFFLPVMFRILSVLIEYYRKNTRDLLIISDGPEIDILVSVDIRYDNKMAIRNIKDYDRLPDDLDNMLTSRLSLQS